MRAFYKCLCSGCSHVFYFITARVMHRGRCSVQMTNTELVQRCAPVSVVPKSPVYRDSTKAMTDAVR